MEIPSKPAVSCESRTFCLGKFFFLRHHSGVPITSTMKIVPPITAPTNIPEKFCSFGANEGLSISIAKKAALRVSFVESRAGTKLSWGHPFSEHGLLIQQPKNRGDVSSHVYHCPLEPLQSFGRLLPSKLGSKVAVCTSVQPFMQKSSSGESAQQPRKRVP